MAIRTSWFKADYHFTTNSFLRRAIGLTLCFCVCVRASPQSSDSETVPQISYGGGLYARTCLPLSTLVNPEVGVPSTWFKAVCHCSKTSDSSICPEWSVAGGSNTNEVFLQNVSLINGKCVANLFLKANIKENLGTIHLKCKLPGIRSAKRTIIIQKVGNRLPCSEDGDCRYPQQACQKEYSQAVSKICKCPFGNDIFDPIHPDVCFKDLDPGSDALGIKPICIFVLISVLIAGVVMGVVKVFVNTMCCAGLFDRPPNWNSVSLRHSEPFHPVPSQFPQESDNPPDYQQVQHHNRECPPPSYNSVILQDRASLSAQGIKAEESSKDLSREEPETQNATSPPTTMFRMGSHHTS